MTIINYANRFEINSAGKRAIEFTQISNERNGFTLDFLEDDYNFEPPTEITPTLTPPPAPTIPDPLDSSPIDIDSVMHMDFFPEPMNAENGVTFTHAEDGIRRDENGFPILDDPNDLYSQNSADTLGIVVERKIFDMQNYMRTEPEKYLGDLENLLSMQANGRETLNNLFNELFG